MKENCHSCRTSDFIAMKLGPVTKFGKRNTETSNNLMMTSGWKIVTLLSFVQFIANLEQSVICIPGAWSVKLTFSLTITFYLAKTKNRTKTSLTYLPYYWFE